MQRSIAASDAALRTGLIVGPQRALDGASAGPAHGGDGIGPGQVPGAGIMGETGGE